MQASTEDDEGTVAGGDAALAADLARGGEARRRAIGVLYARLAGRIVGRYRRLGASEEEAEAWLHDTFVRLLRGGADLARVADLEAWTWTVARNVRLDALRAAGLREVEPLEVLERADAGAPNAPPADEAAARALLRECLARAFAAFGLRHPERARSLGWLAEEGLAIAAIAARLGRTPGATREYLSQCRHKLRPYVEPCLRDAP